MLLQPPDAYRPLRIRTTKIYSQSAFHTTAVLNHWTLLHQNFLHLPKLQIDNAHSCNSRVATPRRCTHSFSISIPLPPIVAMKASILAHFSHNSAGFFFFFSTFQNGIPTFMGVSTNEAMCISHQHQKTSPDENTILVLCLGRFNGLAISDCTTRNAQYLAAPNTASSNTTKNRR